MKNVNVGPQFVLGGQATFTVSNGSGKHFTYHVYKAKPTDQYPGPAWFAKVLTGPNNEEDGDYTYIGKLHVPHERDQQLHPLVSPAVDVTRRSPFKRTDDCVRVLNWAFRVIWQEASGSYHLPPHMSIHHEGRCGKCGAKLTHPASVDTGLGPDCAAALGVHWSEKVSHPLLEEVTHGTT